VTAGNWNACKDLPEVNTKWYSTRECVHGVNLAKDTSIVQSYIGWLPKRCWDFWEFVQSRVSRKYWSRKLGEQTGRIHRQDENVSYRVHKRH